MLQVSSIPSATPRAASLFLIAVAILVAYVAFVTAWEPSVFLCFSGCSGEHCLHLTVAFLSVVFSSSSSSSTGAVVLGTKKSAIFLILSLLLACFSASSFWYLSAASAFCLSSLVPLLLSCIRFWCLSCLLAACAEGMPSSLYHSWTQSFLAAHRSTPAFASLSTAKVTAFLSRPLVESTFAGMRPTHPHQACHPSVQGLQGLVWPVGSIRPHWTFPLIGAWKVSSHLLVISASALLRIFVASGLSHCASMCSTVSRTS